MSNQTNTVKRGRPPKAKRAERPTRIPMSGQRMRMHIDEEYKDSNFHYGWINDQKDLIHRAKRAGFEHVTLEEMPHWGTPSVDSANPASSVVSMKVGQDVTAFLMKQPMEFYLEDKAEMDAIVDGREADMKKELNSGEDGTYGNVEIA